jgi:hypothetical protein
MRLSAYLVPGLKASPLEIELYCSEGSIAAFSGFSSPVHLFHVPMDDHFRGALTLGFVSLEVHCAFGGEEIDDGLVVIFDCALERAVPV